MACSFAPAFHQQNPHIGMAMLGFASSTLYKIAIPKCTLNHKTIHLMRTWRNILFFLLASASLLAQTARDYKITVALELFDGSQLLGQLIHDDNRSVQIRIASGDTLDIGHGYIRKIRTASDRMNMFRKGKFHFIDGDYAGIALGFSGSGEAGTHLQARYARRLTPRSSLGIGLGLDIYQGGLTFDTYSFISLYAYGRHYLNRQVRRTKPYVSMGLGYGLVENTFNQWRIQEGNYNGGPMANPTIGLHFASKSKLKFLLGLTWMVQYNRANYSTPDWFFGLQNVSRVRESNWFIRGGLKLSVEFN